MLPYREEVAQRHRTVAMVMVAEETLAHHRYRWAAQWVVDHRELVVPDNHRHSSSSKCPSRAHRLNRNSNHNHHRTALVAWEAAVDPEGTLTVPTLAQHRLAVQAVAVVTAVYPEAPEAVAPVDYRRHRDREAHRQTVSRAVVLHQLRLPTRRSSVRSARNGSKIRTLSSVPRLVITSSASPAAGRASNDKLVAQNGTKGNR